MKKLFFAAVLLATALAFAQFTVPNEIRNPGFEDTDERGDLAVWQGDKSVFQRVTDVARNGQASLHFQCDDDKVYVLLTQECTADFDKPYEFGVWARTGAQMKGHGPSICIRWWDKDGNFVSGEYAGCVADSKGDWKLTEGYIYKPSPIATRFEIAVHCGRGTTGEAWFDDCFLREVVPSALGPGATDHYRDTVKNGEEFTVKIGIHCLDKANTKAYAESATLSYLVDGITIAQFKPISYTDDHLTFKIEGKKYPLPRASQELLVQAFHPELQKELTYALPITCVEEYPKYKSYIDEHHRLIFDGKPFFPLGMYFGGIKEEDIERFSESTMNCIMDYGMPSHEQLNMLHKKGIKIIYSLKDLYPGHLDVTTQEDADKRCMEAIRMFREHPALLAWYTNDEDPLHKIDMLARRKALINRLDPDHPTWIALYQISEVRGYLPSYDIIGTDPYPVPHKPISLVNLFAEEARKGCFDFRAHWMIPQVFNWAAYWHGYDRTDEQVAECHAPTYEEMKAMAWMCIANGANGLIHYCWQELRPMSKTIAEGGHAVKPDPFEERWEEIKKFNKEISDLFDVLLSIDEPVSIVKAKGCKDLVYRLYGKGDETWLLMVNGNEYQPEEATFFAAKELQLLETKLGASTPVVDGNSIHVTLQPREVLFLRMK